MKFLDVFNEISKGNYALTEEAIYFSIDNRDEMVPLWGGNKYHRAYERMVSVSAMTKKNTKITVFSGEGIIISLDGSAGSMTYKCNEKFALNHHAGFITSKSKVNNVVNLEYFALFFQNLYRSLSVSEGSKTLSLQQIYAEEFELPEYKMQNKIMAKIKPFVEKIRALDCIKLFIENELLKKEIVLDVSEYQAKGIPITDVIDYVSGNSGLTEEIIYSAMQRKGIRYEVLSSTTVNRAKMGEIPDIEIKGRQLKKFEGREGLLVNRKGKAGMTRVLPCGEYTINDDAYILFVRSTCQYKIDLKWLAIQYRQQFLDYCSSSDNSTWNMTGFFSNVIIDIPSIENQKRLVNLWNMAETHFERIEKVQSSFDSLVSKEIAL